MSLRQWNVPNDPLKSLCAAIQQGTNGLIQDLSLDLSDNGSVICGTSRSYYGAQLAIHVAMQFAEGQPRSPAIQLLLSVDEHPLRLTVEAPSKDEARQAASTRGATCHPEVTVSASH